MPITYKIDSAAGIVFGFVKGDFTLDEMFSTISSVVKDPEFRPGMVVLSDHRDVRTPATSDQVQSLVRYTRQFEALAGTKWAVVTTNDLSFGMMRMLSAFAETISLRVEVFRDYDQAMAWLSDKSPTGGGGLSAPEQ